MKKRTCMALIFVLLFTGTACGTNREKSETDMEQKACVSESVLPDAESEEAKGTELQAEAAQTEIQPTESAQESTEQEVTEMKMKIQVGDTVFTAALAENSSVDALKELMADGPLTLDMSDYAGMEKGADLGVTLPQNNEPMNTQAGDIILYQGRTFVIYYDTNSWSLTPIGKIDNVDAESLKAALGTGDVTVTLSID